MGGGPGRHRAELLLKMIFDSRQRERLSVQPQRLHVLHRGRQQRQGAGLLPLRPGVRRRMVVLRLLRVKPQRGVYRRPQGIV